MTPVKRLKQFSRPLLTLALAALAIAGLACGLLPPVIANTPAAIPSSASHQSPSPTAAGTETDAPPPPPVGEYEIEDVEFTVKSPNGYDLSVRSIRPKLSQYPDEKFPAVLRLAGGWGPMTGLLNGEMTKKAASDGLIFVAFDSPMRTDYPVGSPERDYKGFEDQDDVAVVLKDIVENPQVDKDLIGVWTSSSGAILAAGVLGREEYQELSEKIAFFLDSEGPHCVEDLINDPNINNELLDKWIMVKNAKVGPGKDYPTEEEFWYERCGNNFIGNYTGIYQRIQGKDDHALGYYYPHAIAYLNTATNGNAKWTRLNRQPENQVYKSEQYPDGIDIGEVLDVERLDPNDRRIWNVFFSLLEEIRGTSVQEEREPDKEIQTHL